MSLSCCFGSSCCCFDIVPTRSSWPLVPSVACRKPPICRAKLRLDAEWDRLRSTVFLPPLAPFQSLPSYLRQFHCGLSSTTGSRCCDQIVLTPMPTLPCGCSSVPTIINFVACVASLSPLGCEPCSVAWNTDAPNQQRDSLRAVSLVPVSLLVCGFRRVRFALLAAMNLVGGCAMAPWIKSPRAGRRLGASLLLLVSQLVCARIDIVFTGSTAHRSSVPWMPTSVLTRQQLRGSTTS